MRMRYSVCCNRSNLLLNLRGARLALIADEARVVTSGFTQRRPSQLAGAFFVPSYAQAPGDRK